VAEETDAGKAGRAPVAAKGFSCFILAGSFFIAWLWSFPLFGPVLASLAARKGIPAQELSLLWLLAHAAGLFFCGWRGGRRGTAALLVPGGMWDSALLSALGTAAFLLVREGYSYYMAAAALGLLSAPFMVGYGVSLARTCPGPLRGKVFGLTLALGVILHIPFLVPAVPSLRAETATAVVSCYPLVALACLRAYYSFSDKGLALETKNLPDREKGREIHGPSVSGGLEKPEPAVPRIPWPFLITIIGVFYLTGGFMYNLLYPELVLSTGTPGTAGILLYLPAAVAGGWLADRKGRKFLVNAAVTAEGFGFLLLALPSVSGANWVGLGFLQFGFAWMDLFVWLILADIGAVRTEQTVRIFGVVLGINAGAVAASSAASFYLSHSEVPVANFQPYLAAGILFALFPLIAALRESPFFEGLRAGWSGPEDRLGTQKTAEPAVALPPFVTEADLTPQEQKIASLLLEGRDLAEIRRQLSISPNTLKTHLRNIYRKTATSGQKEFFRRAWQEATKGRHETKEIEGSALPKQGS